MSLNNIVPAWLTWGFTSEKEFTDAMNALTEAKLEHDLMEYDSSKCSQASDCTCTGCIMTAYSEYVDTSRKDLKGTEGDTHWEW